MIDICGECGWLATTLQLQQLIQMLIQGRWLTDSPLTILPNVEPYVAQSLHAKPNCSLPAAVHAAAFGYSRVATLFSPELDEGQIEQVNTFTIQ